MMFFLAQDVCSVMEVSNCNKRIEDSDISIGTYSSGRSKSAVCRGAWNL